MSNDKTPAWRMAQREATAQLKLCRDETRTREQRIRSMREAQSLITQAVGLDPRPPHHRGK